MTILSRRTLLAGAAAAGASTSFGWWSSQSARAATPPAGKQAASFYRYKVGTVEITVVSDGVNRFPIPPGFVLNATKDEINAALAESFMEKDFFTGPYNPIVMNTGSKLVLVDMGTGEATYNASKGVNSQLLTNLA